MNSVEIARVGWRELGADTGADARFVHVTCSDPDEHRRRVESRTADLDGLVVPTWDDVQRRAWEPLHDHHLAVDNLGDPEPHVAAILAWLEDQVRTR